MRIAVVGSSGSGKSTFARRLGDALGQPVIELDAINWQSGWKDLVTTDPDAFVRRVEADIRGDNWVVDGNYGVRVIHLASREDRLRSGMSEASSRLGMAVR